MKAVLAAVISSVLLMGAPNVFAISDYQLGLKFGMIDGKHAGSVTGTFYILQPGKGFINQTKEFINGYVTGYCKITGNATGFESDQAQFNCKNGPSSADWVIPYHIQVTHSEYIAGYKEGFAEGVKDGHDLWFHHAKIWTYQPGFGDGYVDGWRSTCKDNGLATGPDSSCELSMDANTE
jgi:hypothetical protein